MFIKMRYTSRWLYLTLLPSFEDYCGSTSSGWISSLPITQPAASKRWMMNC